MCTHAHSMTSNLSSFLNSCHQITF
jgi:hypothetical protein